MGDDATKTGDKVSKDQHDGQGGAADDYGKQEFDADCEPCVADYGELPPIDFTSFVFSLSTSTMIFLGVLPDPATSKQDVDLAMAKQHIDILGMLKDKTAGNLSEEEAAFLERSLYDLRMRFVTACTE
jgi:Domain of unknown function (DUF1844)